jgi:hypothetical protein
MQKIKQKVRQAGIQAADPLVAVSRAFGLDMVAKKLGRYKSPVNPSIFSSTDSSRRHQSTF